MVFYSQENSIINALWRYDHLVQRKSDACMIMWSQPFEILIQTILFSTAGLMMSSERTASQIPESIIELALLLKSQDNKIPVSLIIPRNDNLNNKAREVNSRLIHMCAEWNIPYIEHSNSIQSENHLNKSNLHFNRFGTIVFANNISKFLYECCWWYYDSSNILIICLKKILTKSRKVVHNL